MKRRVCLSIVFIVFVFSGVYCHQHTKFEIAYKIGEKDLLPEGITFSKTTGSFYLSSINKKKIIEVDSETGTFRDFITAKNPGMLILGLGIDEKNKFLWACGERLGQPGETALLKFNLISGELITTYRDPNSPPFGLNDLILDNQNNIYYTHRSKNAVLFLNIKKNQTTTFYSGEDIKFPNGIAISENGDFIYVATAKGVRTVAIKTRELVDTINPVIKSNGIDGMKYYKNSLIAVQNGFEDKTKVNIGRYFLDDKGINIIKKEVIDRNNPHFNLPTTFVIKSNFIYCIANSQIGQYSEKGLKDPSSLQDVIILKYKLD